VDNAPFCRCFILLEGLLVDTFLGLADNTSASEFVIEKVEFDGMLGLGLQTSEDSFIGHVLKGLGPANHCISMLLARNAESPSAFEAVPEHLGESKMVFGGVLSKFKKVLEMPKLDVLSVNQLAKTSGRSLVLTAYAHVANNFLVPT